MNFQHKNELIHSSSPYLLQHAHNPVNWIEWDDEMIKKSDLSGKLVLVSIGYAACHWCHVMEKESFENEDVARIMNEFFVCIKVDREERPDVDHFYMAAIHLMGMQGGWPLNIIALPDGRPIWGGTYFQAQAWVDQIVAVADFWQHNKDKAIAYADKLQAGIEATVLNVQQATGEKPDQHQIEQAINSWKKRFDFEYGGMNGHPKFPMPVNFNFLLYYGTLKNDSQILDFVQLTLEKMAFGGLYDQIGGGFARYSTDEKWKVPHFEKMLYDNGQLLSLFSNAYRKFKTEDFKSVVYQTTEFIERELMSPEGAFYSSLDADSEGVEGKFYVWMHDELLELLKEDFNLFSQYYNINSKGLWEDGNYILLREMNLEDFAARHDLSATQFSEKVAAWRKLLLQKRSSRIRPALDDKTLLSWNALVITGLADAFKAFGDPYFKRLALKNAEFIRDNLILENGSVYHSWKNGHGKIQGFQDDYALFIQAGLALYEITGEQNWFDLAGNVLRFAVQNFYDKNSGLFYYAQPDPSPTITNHFQTEDNVIPAANSVMAHNLHAFYLLNADIDMREMLEKMLSQMNRSFQQYPYAFANWGSLLLKQSGPYFEVAVMGMDAEEKIGEMQSIYLPNVLWAFAKGESSVPLLKNKNVDGETFIYVCREGSCRLPVKDVTDAVRQIQGELKK